MGELDINNLEGELRSLSAELTSPRARECLLCYLYRMLDFGCRGHAFTERYRDEAAPRSTALLRRLARMGACCCECEVFLNAFQPNPRHVPVGENGDFIMSPVPECHGVRRGSTQPCCLWVRSRHGRWR